MQTFTPDYLTDLTARILTACDTPPDDARLVAELIVSANIKGLDSHGILRIPQYIKNIREGTIKPAAPIEITKATSTTAMLDANWNFGHLGARRATQMAIDKARAGGLGAVGLHRCIHVGCVGQYPEMAAAQQMVALAACSGAAPSGHWVAPGGGRQGRIGTNPVAMAAPTTGRPILVDLATSTISEGKVRLYRDTGRRLPDQWLVDAAGRPTDDPHALYAEPPGAILPVGGKLAYKGYAFALIAQVLSTILTGSSLRHLAEESNNFWILAIDISSFMSPEDFAKDMDELIAYNKSAAPAQGADAIIMPGELDYATMDKRLSEGIPVDDEIWQQIQNVAAELSVQV